MSALSAVLQRRYGNAEWNAVLRATGVIGALAIYPTWRWPAVAGAVGFLCVTLFMSGPISMVLPAAYEPLLMLTGRIYPPLLVAVIAIAGDLYINNINYHTFFASMSHPRRDRV